VDQCHEEDITVVSNTGQRMSSNDFRRLTRRVCESNDPDGWTFLLDELRLGMPSYHAIDELIKMCEGQIRQHLDLADTETIAGELKLDFESSVSLPLMERIVIQLERILQGKNSVFHLFLLGPEQADDDIVPIVEALGELYCQLRDNTAIVAVT